MKNKRLPQSLKLTLRGLPLAGAALTALLPLPHLGQQFLILIVLLWLQVFFVVEIFLTGR
jgi:hypothetical protein